MMQCTGGWKYELTSWGAHVGEIIGVSDVCCLGCHTIAYQVGRTFFPGVLIFSE